MADDGWRWYAPAKKVHLVRGGATSTLCGLDAPKDQQEQTDEYLDVPLPYSRGYCRNCRAAFAREQMDAVDIDLDDVSEGDGLVFWDGGDPTDPSDTPLRRSGIVEELPPFKMFEGTRKDTLTVTDRVKVRMDRMTLTNVPTEGRIYRVISDPDPDAVMSGGVADMMEDVLSSLGGGD